MQHIRDSTSQTANQQ